MGSGFSKKSEGSDFVVISIDEKLRGLSSVSSSHCILKVPNHLRMANEMAYEPQIISIGPYHHGKLHLKPMEEHKIRYLQRFLQRQADNTLPRLVEAMRVLEERVRICYSEPVSLAKDEFVEMMALDGCFICDFLCELYQGYRNSQDPVVRNDQIIYRLLLDLLLIENQLPFFLIMELFVKFTAIPDINEIIKLILSVFTLFLPGQPPVPNPQYTIEQIGEIKHVLALIHQNWQPSPERMYKYREMKEIDKISFTRCAVGLKEAGIKFKTVEKRNFFDISFENGVLQIPTFQIHDDTDRIMRNLIAYEQQNSIRNLHVVTNYMSFMDTLINSGKDVELLCRGGIINHLLGSDEAVATLFNKIGNNVFCDRALYADIQSNVDKHCKKPWNVWMYKLRHNYFNSPWALISVLAATLLLVLTFSQTLYSAFSYTHPHK